MKAEAKLFIPVMWFRYLSHMRAAKTRRACTFAQSRQSLRWLHLKKGYRWRLRPNCLYQLCDLGTFMYMYRIFEQQKTRRACTFAQSCQIMFELLSSCEWEYLLSTLEKSEKTCRDDLGFFTCTKVKGNQTSVIRYHGSGRYLPRQNSPHKEEAAFNNMTNMYQCIFLCKFKIQ